MTKITLRELKRHLGQRSQAELAADIVDLFTRLDPVKDYYHIRLDAGHDEELIAKYKAAIEREFFPTRGFGRVRLATARKAITDYKKVSASIAGLVDLMLFYVEMGVRFTNTYGDIDEPFYNSMESMYARAAKIIVEHQLRDQFEPRCRRIVADTTGIGWGFHDNLNIMYGDFFDGTDTDTDTGHRD